MKRSLAAWAVGVVPMSSIASLAWAAEPGVAVGASTTAAPTANADAAKPDAAKPDAAKPKGKRARVRNADFKRLPWIRRWAPQRNLGEIGVSGGVFIPNEQHDLYDPKTTPPEPFWRAGGLLAVRGGFYPLRSLGVEAEFSAMPTRIRNITNDFAFTYGVQGHVVFQLPYYSVVPFFLVGGGLLGVRSNALILGDDVDPALHYGGGVKVQLTKVIGLRVEARNIMSANSALQNAGGANVQVMGGITFTLGRRPPPPPPEPPPPVDPDRDKDGFVNEKDDCPDVVGVAPHGCPTPTAIPSATARMRAPRRPASRPTAARSRTRTTTASSTPTTTASSSPRPRTTTRTATAVPTSSRPRSRSSRGRSTASSSTPRRTRSDPSRGRCSTRPSRCSRSSRTSA